MSDVQNRILAELKSSGGISSKVVSKVVTEQNEQQKDEPKPGENMDKETVTPASDKTKNFVTERAKEKLNNLMKLLMESPDNPLVELAVRAALDFKQVKITPQDKQLFLNAIVTGERMRSEHTAYGGSLSLMFQSRLASETQAVVSELRRSTTAGLVRNDLEYGDRALRLCLRLQLVSLNGAVFQPVVGTELMPKIIAQNGMQKVMPADWIAEADDLFKNVPDAIYNVMLAELRKFEFKYNTMIAKAQDQNFWNPEESIAD